MRELQEGLLVEEHIEGVRRSLSPRPVSAECYSPEHRLRQEWCHLGIMLATVKLDACTAPAEEHWSTWQNVGCPDLLFSSRGTIRLFDALDQLIVSLHCNLADEVA